MSEKIQLDKKKFEKWLTSTSKDIDVVIANVERMKKSIEKMEMQL